MLRQWVGDWVYWPVVVTAISVAAIAASFAVVAVVSNFQMLFYDKKTSDDSNV